MSIDSRQVQEANDRHSISNLRANAGGGTKLQSQIILGLRQPLHDDAIFQAAGLDGNCIVVKYFVWESGPYGVRPVF